MNLSLETLQDFGTRQTLTQTINYEVSASSDYKKTAMLETLGFEPSDITKRVLNHKVFISGKSYKDTLLAISNKEIDLEGIKAQFSTDSVDLQLAIKDAVEIVKENNADKEVGKRSNNTQAINGALSVTSKGNFQLNFYGIYKNPKNFSSTLMIKGVEATEEQILNLVPFWSAKKKKANEPKENNGFASTLGIKKHTIFRNLGLDKLIQ